MGFAYVCMCVCVCARVHLESQYFASLQQCGLYNLTPCWRCTAVKRGPAAGWVASLHSVHACVRARTVVAGGDEGDGVGVAPQEGVVGCGRICSRPGRARLGIARQGRSQGEREAAHRPHCRAEWLCVRAYVHTCTATQCSPSSDTHHHARANDHPSATQPHQAPQPHDRPSPIKLTPPPQATTASLMCTV